MNLVFQQILWVFFVFSLLQSNRIILVYIHEKHILLLCRWLNCKRFPFLIIILNLSSHFIIIHCWDQKTKITPIKAYYYQRLNPCSILVTYWYFKQLSSGLVFPEVIRASLWFVRLFVFIFLFFFLLLLYFLIVSLIFFIIIFIIFFITGFCKI